jgi:cytochrome P450
VRRTASRDTEHVSGNRDETVFDDADRFDVRRTPNPHQGFGGGGRHFCLEAGLPVTVTS